MTTTILTGHVLDRLRDLPDESVQLVVTSPPFYGLRSYGTAPQVWGGDPDHAHDFDGNRLTGKRNPGGVNYATSGLGAAATARKEAIPRGQSYGSTCACGAWKGELGAEPTPEQYVANLVAVFRAVWRVLRADGVCIVDLGDSYAGSGKGTNDRRAAKAAMSLDPRRYAGLTRQVDYDRPAGKGARMGSRHGDSGHTSGVTPPRGFKAKDLLMLPAQVAIALRQDGWYLRSQVPWVRTACLPESVADRPTNAVSYQYLLAKSPHYFWDATAVRKAASLGTHTRGQRAAASAKTVETRAEGRNNVSFSAATWDTPSSRNLRTSDFFWADFRGLLLDHDGAPAALILGPEASKEAHYATFGRGVVTPWVEAATSKAGCCPSCGAPWVRLIERPFYGANHDHRKDAEQGAGQNAAGRNRGYKEYKMPKTVGWRPGCVCSPTPEAQTPGLEPRDADVIATPTGHRADPDPTLDVGRGGFARTADTDEGTRLITRYEQRHYAAQLRAHPDREALALEAGSAEAFRHYLRVDGNGARPIAPKLLADWLERGVLQPPPPFVQVPYEAVPCVVLDPFLGSGTVAVVAAELGRDAVGIELNAAYAKAARARVDRAVLPMLDAIDAVPDPEPPTIFDAIAESAA